MLMPPVVGYGYFLESPNINCNTEFNNNYMFYQLITKFVILFKPPSDSGYNYA